MHDDLEKIHNCLGFFSQSYVRKVSDNFWIFRAGMPGTTSVVAGDGLAPGFNECFVKEVVTKFLSFSHIGKNQSLV